LTGTNEKTFYSDLDEATRVNKAEVGRLVQEQEKVLWAKNLKRKLEEHKADFQRKIQDKQDILALVGYLPWAPDFVSGYQEVIQGLATAITSIQQNIDQAISQERQWEKNARQEIELDRTINKLKQSPVWNLAESYANKIKEPGFGDTLKDKGFKNGLNEYADAGLGKVYQVAHIATSRTALGEGAALHDFASGASVPPSTWDWHFATVVARSGGDRVTLENYARGDDRRGDNDPRWYFQMYGSKPGQSFHEAAVKTNTFANPITVVHNG
jgi:hypothetical protein